MSGWPGAKATCAEPAWPGVTPAAVCHEAPPSVERSISPLVVVASSVAACEGWGIRARDWTPAGRSVFTLLLVQLAPPSAER